MPEKNIDTLPPSGTFFDAPACNNLDELSADIAFLGVPYELGKPLRILAGQKEGPKAIRNMSKTYSYSGNNWGIISEEDGPGWFDADTGKWQLRGITMADCGDIDIIAPEGDRNCDKITRVIRRILDCNSFPVSIGGDHTITFPIVRAFDRYDSIDIVDFDAHLDFNDSINGSKLYSGSPMRRCSELPFIHNITMIGINGIRYNKMSKRKNYDAAIEYGCNIISAKKFREMGVSQVVGSIPPAKNIYVTVDVDVLNPSSAPGTGALNPGGLSFLEVRDTLVEVSKKGKVIGFDLVCILPARDPSGITAQVGVDLTLDFLATVFPSRW